MSLDPSKPHFFRYFPLSPRRMEASDLSSPGSTAQQCTGCPQRSWPACRCDGPGGSSLPAAVGTSMLGARCQVRPSCRAFVHSVRWELAPPFSQQRKLRCRRVRWPFPADSGDEGRLSFGLRSVRFRSPGPPGRFTKIQPVNDWPPERSRPPSCLPSQTQKCRAGHGEWRRLPLSFQEQPGLTSSR